MGAKEKWLAGDVTSARAILNEAFRANPDSEQVWLAAVKLESENNEPDRARMLLAKARERAGTERVWMKSAVLEITLKASQEALKMADQALAIHPRFWKLYLVKAQLLERLELFDEARETLSKGTKACPDCVPVWLGAARLEETRGNVSKARSILEIARLKINSPQLWLAAVRVERKAANHKAAATLMAKVRRLTPLSPPPPPPLSPRCPPLSPPASPCLLPQALQQCRNAGTLWAEAIAMEPRAQQKTKSSDALKACDNDPHVIVAVRRLRSHPPPLPRSRPELALISAGLAPLLAGSQGGEGALLVQPRRHPRPRPGRRLGQLLRLRAAARHRGAAEGGAPPPSSPSDLPLTLSCRPSPAAPRIGSRCSAAASPPTRTTATNGRR